jgi:membrane-bound lytic murein transglycosylase D
LTAVKWYTVRRGETLTTIARKLSVSRTDLAEANRLTTKARVGPGQLLIIPRAPANVLAARADRPSVPTLSASRNIAEAGEDAPSVRSTSATSARITYRVKRGDTLFSIAQLFNTTVDKIKSWNRLTTSRVTAGTTLKIYGTRTVASR